MRITETVSHPADPQRVHQMLTDHDFQVARAERSGATDQTVTVDTDPEDGAVTVTVQRHLPSTGVPEWARAFVGPTLLMVETVRWGAADADGEREGAMGLELPGLPVSFTGGIHLRRGQEPGTTLHVVDGDLEAKVPFFGKRIEEMVAAQMHRIVALEEQVAREWLQTPGPPPAG
ncbi:DUF2505 domain-containing protein [Ornithinimicrobium flavum]|uniref:DUF2505 domain-containing protein n=1 Tax=Ornithinimicrobium flavum TaxID=1288636 RepID=UPI00106F3AE2|nr:DUF2505 domain-containing protein [Ornithinimicrobium flavum]